MIEFILIALLALNVFQLVYWSRQVHVLIDKLMSRNYAEYAHVNDSLKVPLPVKLPEIDQGPDADLDLLNQQLAGFGG